jgi:microcin C transport system substrate-binding protein
VNSAIARLVPVVLMVGLAACGGGSEPGDGGAGGAGTPRGNVSLDKNDYPVFPDADAGADPAVPAELGGRGFTGEGWETNTDFDLIGDPRAVKGGVLRDALLDFPGTLRIAGPESNTAFNFSVSSMVYEALVTLHPTTLEFVPALATHWQISPDRMTYRFRINPNARWSDGQPVVAEDVRATWDFMMDPTLQDPMNTLVYGKFERPVVESKYIVRVGSKETSWRNFLYFGGSMFILPAHVLAKVNGATYLKEYNTRLLPGTGPYVLNEADIQRGKSISVRRRPSGYWAENHRRNIGANNFDELRSLVVRDHKLMFEMFKRGDLDYYIVGVSREWVEELNFDRVQRGLIQKRKIFNDEPQGVSGLAINTRRPPYTDVRVRQALAHLQNRQLMIEKLFFNEYLPLNSYYPGTMYENPDNPKMPYDPQRALALLAEAGWKSRDAQGRLVKDGRPLTIELIYQTQASEPSLTVYQEDLRRVGITLNLRLITPETAWQLMMQRRFDVAYTGWTGLLFPNPETSYHSRLADSEGTNNITGMKNARLDQLFVQYDREFDPARRAAIIREVDGILANEHHYVLGWYGPFTRIAYWNKFGHPEGYLTRTQEYYMVLPSLWWIDPQREQQLLRAMGDASIKLPVGDTEVRYWQEYAKTHPMGAPTSR